MLPMFVGLWGFQPLRGGALGVAIRQCSSFGMGLVAGRSRRSQPCSPPHTAPQISLCSPPSHVCWAQLFELLPLPSPVRCFQEFSPSPTTRGSPSSPHLTRSHCFFLSENSKQRSTLWRKTYFSLFTLKPALDPNVPIATLILQVAPTV